jgi:transcriptional regulator with XRE-family HTH domain
MGVKLTDEQVVELREAYNRGDRQVDLGRRYGISQNTVSSLVTGRTRKDAGGPVSPASSRKLTNAQALAIREAVADGTPVDELTRRYEITQQMVSQIVTGVAYATAGGPISKPTRRNASPLTVDEADEIRSRVQRGIAVDVVAATFGVSTSTVRSVMAGRTRGRSLETGPALTADEVREIRIRHRNGVTQAELAAEFGVSQQMISRIVLGHQYASYGGPIAGRRRRRTPDEVRRIREAAAAGATISELAGRYDTTVVIIQQIVDGVTYADVPSSRTG